jgi:hypothetical protein
VDKLDEGTTALIPAFSPRRRGTRRTLAEVHVIVVLMLLWNSRTVMKCAQITGSF